MSQQHVRHGRKTPYTSIGVRRLPCARCGQRASRQWNACADGLYRPICDSCDLALNHLVLTFMRDPETARKLAVYKLTF